MSLTENTGEDSIGIAEETVAVYSAPDMIAAELLRGTLEVEGIDAVIGEQVTGVYAGALAVGEGYAAEVLVPVESVEAAQEIVLRFIRDTESGANQPVSDEDLTAQAEAAYDPQV